MMFYRSHITALLSHFFGQLAIKQEEASKPYHREQLNKALSDIEKLKDKQREFANGNSH